MRAIGLTGHEAAAVERGGGTDAIGHRGGSAHGEGAAHAVPHRAHLPAEVHGWLGVEEVDERNRVPHLSVRVQRPHQRHERVTNFGEIRGVDDRRPLRPVVLVDHQDRVA